MIPWDTYYLCRSERYFPALSIDPPKDGSQGMDAEEGYAYKRLLLARSLLSNAHTRDCEECVDLSARWVDCADLWCEVPLLITHGTKACIYPVLLGRIAQGSIHIERDFLCADAREAAENALRLAGGGQWGFVLLRETAAPLAGIHGGSLALPLATAAKRLVHGQPFPPNVFMTGALDQGGGVVAVDGVRSKQKRVFMHPHTMQRVFFYPSANTELYGGRENSFAVHTLESACAMLALVEDPILLQRVTLWRKAPQDFFSALRRGAIPQDALIPLLTIAESDNWKAGFVDVAAVESAVKDLWEIRINSRDVALNRAVNNVLERLLAFLPNWDSDMLQNMAPWPRWNLANMHIMVENHKGYTESLWRQQSTSARKQMTNSTYGAYEEDVVAIIREEINRPPNAYVFDTAPNQEWMEQVQIIDTMYAQMRAKKKVSVNEALGKAYGALSQRAAFAGEYALALEYNQRSRDRAATYDNLKRRTVDEIYILCDSGMIDEAHHALQRLLGFENGAAINASSSELGAIAAQSDDPYVHAAYLRLCRKNEGFFVGYPVHEIFEQKSQKRHPWQCWACNAGSLLSESDSALAKRLFRFAIEEICLADEHAWTLIPMALPSLAGLLHCDLRSTQYVYGKTEEVLNRIRRACVNGFLNERHFHDVLAVANAAEALQMVEEKMQILFPFNYR